MSTNSCNCNLSPDTAASYKAAIQIIADGKFDARAIAVNLAKVEPALFVQLAIGAPKSDKFVDIVQELLRGSRTEAIRRLRSKTGLGLKEAKDIIDHSVTRLRDQGHVIEADIPFPLPRMTDPEYRIIDEIVGSK